LCAVSRRGYRASVADVDALVLGTVNASWRRAIDASTLADCLMGRRAPGEWIEHVRTFFEDVPREAVFRFLLARALPPAAVLATYRAVTREEERRHGDLDTWLAELA